ncbi:hypothetical protein Y032_0370g95 [Ancylostoma ceylanicum]|uniref:Uncharacterized protein n=1 Tax=Ancylostoma ceylanicum TaxID=53326 RepID=A0A016RUK4_9BILA|nr:hypothetical protein Y032_0370g95 [Ancylostoma ceylanicum]
MDFSENLLTKGNRRYGTSCNSLKFRSRGLFEVLITNINIILHATFVFSLKLAFSLKFLPYTYCIPTKVGLRYKMNATFVISTPNNPPPPGQNLRGFYEIPYLP